MIPVVVYADNSSICSRSSSMGIPIPHQLVLLHNFSFMHWKDLKGFDEAQLFACKKEDRMFAWIAWIESEQGQWRMEWFNLLVTSLSVNKYRRHAIQSNPAEKGGEAFSGYLTSNACTNTIRTVEDGLALLWGLISIIIINAVGAFLQSGPLMGSHPSIYEQNGTVSFDLPHHEGFAKMDRTIQSLIEWTTYYANGSGCVHAHRCGGRGLWGNYKF